MPIRVLNKVTPPKLLAAGFRFSSVDLVVGLGFTLAWHRELKLLRAGDVFVWVGESSYCSAAKLQRCSRIAVEHRTSVQSK